MQLYLRDVEFAYSCCITLLRSRYQDTRSGEIKPNNSYFCSIIYDIYACICFERRKVYKSKIYAWNNYLNFSTIEWSGSHLVFSLNRMIDVPLLWSTEIAISYRWHFAAICARPLPITGNNYAKFSSLYVDQGIIKWLYSNNEWILAGGGVD